MPDYKSMYIELFNRVTDVIKELQQAQRETERIYADSPKIALLEAKDAQTDSGKKE